MDYEKSYNEILSRLRALADAQPGVTKAAIESLFPEISEDEMIRQKLIKIVTNWLSGSPHGIDCVKFMGCSKTNEINKILKWLEKQGEQNKPMLPPIDAEFISELRSILNSYAFNHNGLDVNGDYCEQKYIEIDGWLLAMLEIYKED